MQPPEPSASKSPHADACLIAVDCAVLTVSDTRTPDTDKSGQLMQTQLTAAGHWVCHYQIIKDESAQIAVLVQQLILRPDIKAIFLSGGNGGTGIAPRDTTYDAIFPLLTKELPGFCEVFGRLSYAEIGSPAIAHKAKLRHLAGLLS
ncbi:MAG: molybdopterin-binding protein [Cyanobacteria bacterium J06649_4]